MEPPAAWAGVIALAQQYGISVHAFSEHADWKLGLGGILSEVLGSDFHQLENTAFSISKRKVALADSADEAMVLHEVAHIICAPPNKSIHTTCEAWIQVSFEQAVMKAIKLHRARFYNYLSGATMVGYGNCWAQIAPHHRSQILKQGRLRCQRVGLLDAENRPTYRMPDWSGLTESDLERLHGEAEPWWHYAKH